MKASSHRERLKVALIGTASLILVGAGLGVQSSLAAPPPKMFLANLNAAQQPPSGTGTAGHGNAFLTYDTGTQMLCYNIVLGGLGSAEILAHIHGPALPEATAGIQFPLPGGSSKNGCFALSSTQKQELYKNLYYIDIHTVGFPGGEIRGQILRIK